MKRLTHECDFGFENWKQIGYMVADDKEGFYNILDIAVLSDKPNIQEILKNVSVRLAEYENTELESSEIDKLKRDNAELRKQLESTFFVPCKFNTLDEFFIITPTGIEKRFFLKWVITNNIVLCWYIDEDEIEHCAYIDDFEERLFLTKEEAEQKLKEREQK